MNRPFPRPTAAPDDPEPIPIEARSEAQALAEQAPGTARPGGLEPPADLQAIPPEGKNKLVDLGRIGWLATVLACLIALLILVLQGYYGYAGVTFAVAVSAAINLR